MSCMASQLSGDLPIAFDRRKAISGLTELRSRTTRAKVEAATPIFSANDLILMSNGSIYVTRINSPGCGGLCIRPMVPGLSVIVLIVNENGILALERKRQSPVSAHPNRPMTFLVALQWMELPARHIHVLGPPGDIQSM